MADKKTEKELETIKRKETLEKILAKYKVLEALPEGKPEDSTYSAEYKIFRAVEAEDRLRSTYERLCNFSERTLKIALEGDMKAKFDSDIKFTGLKVTPSGAVSFAVLVTLFFLLIALILFLAPIPAVFKILALITTIVAGFLFYTYPSNLANFMRIDSGNSIVMAVLYMTVYMKSTPNIEGALRFAANNITGKLSRDLKSILWAVESGKYNTVEEGLSNYLMQWREYNKEFVESVLLIREAMIEPSRSRREALYDKAIDVILVGTDEKMKKYARELETPIMILEGLGILLPVMGMIAFPLVMIFMSEEISNLGLYVSLGYDIILPLVVHFFMKRTLQMRPATHTKIDVSQHPDYVSGDNMSLRVFGRVHSVPVLPIAVIVGVVLALPGLNYMISTSFFMKANHGITSMLFSASIIFAAAAGVATYTYGTSFQKLHLRRTISKIEGEFEEALFALGSRLASGTPMETALIDAEDDTKELEISEMFRILLKNIERMSMTFRQALFDKNYGALRYYPSSLVITVMKAISEAVEKGTRAASMSMLTISRYLRDIHSTQEKIENLLSSTISSLKFQGFVLIPVMSAVVVAVAQLMIRILINLGAQFASLQSELPPGASSINPMMIFGDMTKAVPPEMLQLIVGFYVLQLLTIVGMLITRIEFGSDDIEERDTIWRIVIFGTVIYIIVLVVVMAVFSPLIEVSSELSAA